MKIACQPLLNEKHLSRVKLPKRHQQLFNGRTMADIKYIDKVRGFNQWNV